MSNSQPISVCPWCQAQLMGAALSCPGCGAPLKLVPHKTDSGWVELPPIRDMARLCIGNSTCQIEGEYVPVADFNLAAGDAVYFTHHVMLWRDTAVTVQTMPLDGGWKRMMAGLPLIMTEALGPGHIAFSQDEPGETIAVPLQPGQGVHVREHVFMVATKQVQYDWFPASVWFLSGSGKEQETHYPLGPYIDHFSAGAEPGLLLLHARGNAFIRDLSAGQILYVKPTSFLFKDPTVHFGLKLDYAPYALGQKQYLWLELIGPGRVAIQSAYPPMEANEQSITGVCGHAVGYYNARLQTAAASTFATSAARASFGHVSPQNDPRHAQLIQVITQALDSTGQISPDILQKLQTRATGFGLSAYDVKLLINHAVAERRKGT